MGTDTEPAADPDTVSTAYVACYARFLSGFAAAASRWHGSVLVATTGVPLSALNGAAVPAEARAGDVLAAVDDLAGTGLPHVVQAPRGAATGLSARRGYRVARTLPALVHENPSEAQVPAVPGLQLRRVEAAGGMAVHLDLVARAFGLPPAVLAALADDGLLADPDVYAVVGLRDGAAVTTAMAVRVGAWAAVFDVATPEPAGGGQASAATAAVLAGAARGGARRAVLLSTPAALGLYRRLGFREVETWDYWAPPSRDPRCRLSL